MATYKPDPMHSEVTFKVKHLMITNVSGSFGKFDATMTTEKDDFADASISFDADIDSINTGNEQRDGHLKSDDFFNAEKFPKLSFVSTGITKKNGEDYTLTGNMTIRDVTKPITLNANFEGTMTRL